MVIIKISLVCIWEYGLLCSSGQRLFKPFVVVCAFYLPSRSIQLASQCNSFYAKSSLQHLSKNPASHFELMYFCTYAVNRYKIVRRVYSEYHTDYIPMYLSLPCFVLDDGDMVGGKRGRSPRFCRGKRNLLFNNFALLQSTCFLLSAFEFSRMTVQQGKFLFMYRDNIILLKILFEPQRSKTKSMFKYKLECNKK